MALLSTCPPLTRQSVVDAYEVIRTKVHRTPVLSSSTINLLASIPRDEQSGVRRPARPVIRLWFKCENMQKIGAFKARGAFHAIERLKKEPGWIENGGLSKGVIAFSAGNHAQAIALAARENGIPAHIVMPNTSRVNKIEATKAYGANVVLCEQGQREAIAAEIAAETGARLVHPYDHPDVILGQGTASLELQDQVDHLDAIIAPCSGGGLLSGTALGCDGTGVRVFGAEPDLEGADDGRRGFLSGIRITEVKTSTIADGLIGVVGLHPWEIINERRLVTGMFAVSEEEIKQAMKLIIERLKVFIEPSAAVPLAVALYNEEFRALVEAEGGETGWDIGVILSGGNIGLEGLSQIFL